MRELKEQYQLLKNDLLRTQRINERMEGELAASEERVRVLEEALGDAPRLAHFMNSWICEMMDNETICTALREMKEWDALCAFQDMLLEHKEKARQALGDSHDNEGKV